MKSLCPTSVREPPSKGELQAEVEKLSSQLSLSKMEFASHQDRDGDYGFDSDSTVSLSSYQVLVDCIK